MKLMVLDGNSIVNRAFYGVRPLSTKDGLFTNAIYGFLNILQKLLAEHSPDGLCVTFDLKAPTFRHKKYDGYKAQRKPMPEELAMQIPVLKNVLDAMNIRRYELEGFEADDLIGTISAICEKEGWECRVVTGDKDSFQLISEKTHVLHVKSRMGQTETKEYDPAVFAEEYGFSAEKIIDLKAFMGDSSDNIPGVPGVGEKTALELVSKYGYVRDIYDNIDALGIKDSVRKKLVTGREMAELSYDLATICREVPMDFKPNDNLRREVDNDRLYALFQQLEFTKLTERFNLKKPEDSGSTEEMFEAECTSTEVITDNDFSVMKKVIEGCQEPIGVYLDDYVETAVITADTTGFIIDKYKCGDKFDELIKYIFGSEVRKVGHGIKDITYRLLKEGFPSDGWVFDTELAAYLLEPTDNSYDLAKLTQKYCGFKLHDGSEDNGQMSILSDEAAVLGARLSYAASVSAVAEVLYNELEKNGMMGLLKEIEIPLCKVLAEMELAGVLVDQAALADFGVQLKAGEELLEKQIYEFSGEEFNINSPKQLSHILFEKLMLPAPKKTKTGYSTNVEILEKLKNKHPIIEHILQYREFAKLRSTYADGLLKEIKSDGRIHTNYQMTVAATGRLSSTAPNLQNIPVRKALGGEIRKMFVANEGCVFVDADYSQIELRLLAHISDDKVMQEAFKSGEDVHRVTASQVFDVPLEEVTSLQRSRAKAVNFGIVYGISAFSLAQDIGVSVQEAKMYMDSYLSKYHGVRDYMKQIIEKAREDGYVATLYGRRRSLPELKSSNFNLRSFGERVALNMPIQGTAADIMKIAMIGVSRRLKVEGLQAKLLLQIHDELIAECPESEIDKVRKILCEEMENAARLTVPLTADAGVGKSWYEAK